MLRFKQERELKNLSQNELADILGVSQQSISKYENGSREAGYDILIKMSELFNVSIDYLLGISNIPKQETNNFLSPEEKEIVDVYRNLNADGKRILLGKALDLKLSGVTAAPNKKKDIG